MCGHCFVRFHVPGLSIEPPGRSINWLDDAKRLVQNLKSGVRLSAYICGPHGDAQDVSQDWTYTATGEE